MEEMKWFIEVVKEFWGMDINVVLEIIVIYEYEFNVLVKVFFEIIGINLMYILIQEGDVIEKLQI